MADLINSKLYEYTLQEIFSYLSYHDMLRVQKVCRRWEELGRYRWRTLKSLTCDDDECYFSLANGIRELELIDTNDLEATLIRCGMYIEQLRLYRSERDLDGEIFNRRLTTIAQHCDNLNDVCLMRMASERSPITPIRPLLSCKKIESLTIGQLNHDHEDDLSNLLINNENLQYFRLDSACAMTGAFLQYLPATLVSFEILICNYINESLIISAFQRLNYLTCLEFYTLNELPDSVVKVISQKRMLNVLGLSGATRRSQSMFAHLGNLVNLQELTLTNNANLDDEALITICNNCPQLSALSVDECRLLTDSGIAAICQLEDLTELNISVLENVTDRFIGDMSSTLECLYCCQCENVKDDGLIRLLYNAPNLHLIDVSDCFGVTNRFIGAAIGVALMRTGDILEIDVRNCDVNIRQANRIYCRDRTKKITKLRLVYNSSDEESDESSDESWHTMDEDDNPPRLDESSDSYNLEEFFDANEGND